MTQIEAAIYYKLMLPNPTNQYIKQISNYKTLLYPWQFLLKNENDIPHLIDKTQFWMEFLIFLRKLALALRSSLVI